MVKYSWFLEFNPGYNILDIEAYSLVLGKNVHTT
jgi:hypothetical protein